MSRCHNRAVAGVLALSAMLPTLPLWAAQDTPALPPEVLQPDQEGDFETFSVPKPPLPKTRTGQDSTLGADGTFGVPHASAKPGERLNAQVGFRYFPGMTELTTSLSGQVGGRQLEAQLTPSRWLNGDFTNSGYLQMNRGGRGLRFGNTYSDLMGSTAGMQLYGMPIAPRTTMGLGVYQGLGNQMGPGRLLPAAEARWGVGAVNTGLMMASDSSSRFTIQAQKKQWQAQGFAGWDNSEQRNEAGMFLQGSPMRGSTVYGRMLGWSGDRPGGNWSLGWSQQVGPATMVADHTWMQQPGGMLKQWGVGALIPIRRQTLALRWQQNQLEQQGNSRFTHSDGATATFISPVGKTATVWGSFGTYRDTQTQPNTFASVGGAWNVGRKWSLQGELSQRLDENQRRLRMSVGYQVSPQWQAQVLFGPSMAASAGIRPPHVFGFQLVRNLSINTTRTGTLSGQVFQDGAPCKRRVGVMLDDGRRMETNDKGEFRFKKVSFGAHQVRLDPTTVPADLDADALQLSLEVRRRDAAKAVFQLHRVGQIRGEIIVRGDEFGDRDPTAGVGVTVETKEGKGTTTNGENQFVLGGLHPGEQYVRLAVSTIPPDFEVVGQAEVKVSVDPDGTSPMVRFEIAPRRRKIELGLTELPPVVVR